MLKYIIIFSTGPPKGGGRKYEIYGIGFKSKRNLKNFMKMTKFWDPWGRPQCSHYEYIYILVNHNTVIDIQRSANLPIMYSPEDFIILQSKIPYMVTDFQYRV
jgi:hypothetical protein